MKQRFKNILLPDPAKWQFWLVAGMVLKGAIFLLRLTRWVPHHIDGFWGVSEGDTWSYILPIDNLIHLHQYSPDYRMPGYGVIYLPFAMMFSRGAVYNIMITLQLAAACLSVYCLALVAKDIFRSAAMFYLTFYLFGISTFSNMFDTFILTESFSVSFLIFSVYFVVKGLTAPSPKPLYFLLSGVFLTWLIFLRPVFFPLYLLFTAVIFFYLLKTAAWRRMLQYLVLFLVPIVICDGSWITRNYMKYKRVIPVTTSVFYPGIADSYWGPLFIFVQSWGGTDQYFEPTAVIRWFGLDDGLSPEMHNVKVTLPAYIYTSKFNYDSLVVLRSQLREYAAAEKANSADTVRMKAELATIRSKCFLYAQSVKDEKPLLYYFVAPIMRTKAFLLHSGTNNLFTASANHLGALRLGVKGFYTMFYWFVLLFGSAGIVLLARKAVRHVLIMLPLLIPVYTILIHPVILGVCEKRYFVPAYPFMLVLAAYAIYFFWKRLKDQSGGAAGVETAAVN